MQKVKARLKTADQNLPKSLHTLLVSEFSQLLDEDTSPKGEYQRRYWLTKYCETDQGTSMKRRSAAIDKWLKTEERNAETNVRLREELNTVCESTLYTFQTLLNKVSSIVAQVLPWEPSLDFLHGGFSGGASTSKTRDQGHPALKFLGKADATRPAWLVTRDLISGSRWADHIGESWVEPRFVSGSVMFTVPKNADIDRVAAKEPDWNMFFQKALGNQIRFCLRKVGIDLNDQSRNAELARQGSIDGQLMTLDLSSASDSVSYELVKAVMPLNWFYYLDALRSPTVDIDGNRHTMNMFSSMGNGFTFELESLIFYAITRAVAYLTGISGTISVYGDDIIAPSSMYNDLKEALGFFGFQVNPDKSFHDGPFRESCGSYWHAGIDVKPFFLKRKVERLSDLILFLNQLTSWCSVNQIVDPVYEELWLKLREYVPDYLWGGQDLTSRTSLVTGDRPRKELKPVTSPKRHHHTGGLLFWLFVAEGRIVVEDPLNVTGARDSGYARLRRNRQLWTNELPLFLSRYNSVR